MGVSRGQIEVVSDQELPHVQVLRLQSGDVVVFHVDQRMSDEMYDHTITQTKEQFPGHQVLVLDGGMKLSVVRRDGD